MSKGTGPSTVAESSSPLSCSAASAPPREDAPTAFDENSRTDHVLRLDRLSIGRRRGTGVTRILQDITFELPRGRCAFFVGPSGSGKSLLLRCILGLLDPADWDISGHIALTSARTGQRNLLREGQHDPASYQIVRGHSLAAVFQEPTASLHPSLSIGRQMLEVLPGFSREERLAKARAALSQVRLHYPDALSRYPHQFSQGERQRICIAMALCVGGVVLADEPTASLDPQSVAEVMEALRVLRDSDRIDAFIVVTHQPSVIEALYRPGDRFLVLDKDASAGTPSARDVASLPAQGPSALHDCFRLNVPPRRSTVRSATASQPILSVKNLSQKLRRAWFRPSLKILENATFDVLPDEMVGIIGPSGCGKTTLARALIRLIDQTAGEINLRCPDSFGSKEETVNLRRAQPNGSDQDTRLMHRLRRNIQYISQEAATVFNPAMRIGEILAETLALDPTATGKSEKRLTDLCRALGLADSAEGLSDLFDRYTFELSGGQKQRLALLRALLRRPRILVADEPFTGQDLQTTSVILHILDDVRRKHQIGIVLISHDIDLVERSCDRVYRLDGKKLTDVSEPRQKQEKDHGALENSAPSSSSP